MNNIEQGGGGNSRLEAKSRFEEHSRATGNLSEGEILELSAFEYEKGSSGVAENIRRCYLKVKNETPDEAQKMLEDISNVDEATLTEEDVKIISGKVERHISGIMFYYKGKGYSGGKEV